MVRGRNAYGRAVCQEENKLYLSGIMKENTLRITILLVAVLMSVIGLSAQTLLSYSCDFEDRDERSAWQRNFGPDGPYCPSKWEIDTAINNGGKYSMYISPDGGATAGYTNEMEYVVAYRTITLAADQIRRGFTGRHGILLMLPSLPTVRRPINSSSCGRTMCSIQSRQGLV